MNNSKVQGGLLSAHFAVPHLDVGDCRLRVFTRYAPPTLQYRTKNGRIVTTLPDIGHPHRTSAKDSYLRLALEVCSDEPPLEYGTH